MLNHGTIRISVPAGRGNGWAMPASKALDEAKFYTLEEIEEIMNSREEPESTWPGKKESSESEEPATPEEPTVS